MRRRTYLPTCATRCLLVLSTGLAGCSPSSGLFFRPPPHRLLERAEAISQGTIGQDGLPRELFRSVLPEYRVQPGDALLIESRNRDQSIPVAADQTVMPDGTIHLGQYGPIVVAGMTVTEIERAVSDRIQAEAPLEPDAAAPQATVRLIDPQGQVYYVLGEVNAPGSFPVIGRETVLDAIVAAGGLTDSADRHRVIFTRPTEDGQYPFVRLICYRHIVQLGDTSTNFQIQPGDRVFVASQTCTRSIFSTFFPHVGDRCTRCDATACASCRPASCPH